MKLIYLALMASVLIGCDNHDGSNLNDNQQDAANDDVTAQTQTVGTFAKALVESQTSDDGDPVSVDDVQFDFEDTNDDFIIIGL